MGQGPDSRDHSTSDLSRHESYFRRCSSVFVIVFLFYDPFNGLMVFFPGRDYDYQTLNLTFAVNVIKFGLIIGLFPRPLKPCAVSSISVSLSLKPTLVSFPACYRTFLPRFNKKLNSSDLWLRNGLRRWKSTGMTGMISRFVRPLNLVCL